MYQLAILSSLYVLIRNPVVQIIRNVEGTLQNKFKNIVDLRIRDFNGNFLSSSGRFRAYNYLLK